VSPDIINKRGAEIGFSDNGDDLGLGEFRLPHENLLARGNHFTRKFSLESVSDLGELTGTILQDLAWNEKPTFVLSRIFISS
jgi:hypothetical protein